jgi:hypothetical protein
MALKYVAISCVMPFILFTVAVTFAVAVGGVRHIHHVTMDFCVALLRRSIGSSDVVGIVIAAVRGRVRAVVLRLGIVNGNVFEFLVGAFVLGLFVIGGDLEKMHFLLFLLVLVVSRFSADVVSSGRFIMVSLQSVQNLAVRTVKTGYVEVVKTGDDDVVKTGDDELVKTGDNDATRPGGVVSWVLLTLWYLQ